MATPEASDPIDRLLLKSKLVPRSPPRHMGPIEHERRFDQLVGEFCEPSRPAGASVRTAGRGKADRDQKAMVYP
jgi:hypothetical protein